MTRCDILIIGGGAAGLAAAVCARMNSKNIKIIVAEKNDRAAKKILATGNGRCNFTNTRILPEYYYGDRDFISSVLESFPYEKAAELFEKLGVMRRVDDEGRVYPLSNMASSVADALRLYLIENGAELVTGREISAIKRVSGGFETGDFYAKRIIVACGGKAAPHFGTDGKSYPLLTSFGHTLVPPRPALAAIKTDTRLIKGLKGVKVMAKLRIGEHSDEGEVLFTDYGVSGIPAMQISRFAEKGKRLFVDMLPQLSFDEAKRELYERVRAFPKRSAENIFSGIVNKKIAVPMARYAGIEKMNVKCESFTDENIRKCAEYLKNLSLLILGTASFDEAQVTAGGVELTEFDPKTMESRLQKGLFAAGEILDCDGICGGYNLHWAWATGYIAAKGAVDSLC